MENKTTKVIVFELNKEEYAVSVQQVGLIERVTPITRVPQTVDFVKGVINLRGVVTPIIDLRTRFSMEEVNLTEHSRIIIVHLDDKEVGLIVDAANDVVDIPEENIEPAPEVIGAVDIDYIKGVAKLEQRLIILLDLEKVLSAADVTNMQLMKG